jgi:epoxyqueuosine reductase QueG
VIYSKERSTKTIKSEAPRLENWIKNNRHGQMTYMENHFDKRLDPRLLVDGAKSVISLLLNYYPSELHGRNANISKSNNTETKYITQ